MKRNLKKLLATAMVATMLLPIAACGKTEEKPATDDKAKTESAEKTDSKKIGVFFYQFNDTYLSTVRNALKELDDKDDSIEFIFQDAQNDQGKQNDEIDTLLDQVDGYLVNLVDTGAAQIVLEKLKPTDKPAILFNREPDDINSYKAYDKARFVGTKKEEAGVIQGNIISEYWNANKDTVDRNKNGKLDYVLLHGGLDNAEANARSKYSVDTITEAGIEVNEIGMQIANWDTEKAKQAMDAWLAKDEANIDVVIANNDGMAIGAINSLKALGYNDKDAEKHVGVFGVDATEEAKAAIEVGSIDGTVMQDGVAMAEAMYKLAKNAVEGKDYLDETEYKWDESGIAVRIPYKKFEK